MALFNPNFSKFKFKDLKVYASKEWLADNCNKYRQVWRYERRIQADIFLCIPKLSELPILHVGI